MLFQKYSNLFSIQNGTKQNKICIWKRLQPNAHPLCIQCLVKDIAFLAKWINNSKSLYLYFILELQQLPNVVQTSTKAILQTKKNNIYSFYMNIKVVKWLSWFYSCMKINWIFMLIDMIPWNKADVIFYKGGPTQSSIQTWSGFLEM